VSYYSRIISSVDFFVVSGKFTQENGESSPKPIEMQNPVDFELTE